MTVRKYPATVSGGISIFCSSRRENAARIFLYSCLLITGTSVILSFAQP